MSTLSPEVSSLSSMYDTGRKTAEEFAPRGGGRAAALEGLPFQKAGQIESLIGGARERGAAGVTGIAQLLGELGLGELGVGGQIAGSTFNQAEDAKRNQQQQQGALGAGIGSLIGLLAGAI